MWPGSCSALPIVPPSTAESSFVFPDKHIKQYSFNKVTQANRNNLIGTYGVDGIKTGQTDIAGYGIVISAIQYDRRLIAVINGLKTAKERKFEAQNLLNYGFRNFKNLTLFQGCKQVTEADIIYGNLEKIPLNVIDKVVITVPIQYDRMKDLLFLTEFKNPIKAPIKKVSRMRNAERYDLHFFVFVFQIE